MVNMAAIAFLMRGYVGKLFEAGTGIPIQKEKMRDKILDLFDYWEKGTHGEKLDVRFGTEDEERLIETLKDLFKLEDVKSLNDARWKIREWVKKRGFPIYVFKFAENINENMKNAIDTIFNIIQSTDSELTYEKIKEYLKTIENVRYELFILIDRENPKDLFIKWLKSIEGVKISSEEIEGVIEYIKRNMQEEVASWIEDKVREKVKDWDREKLRKKLESLHQGDEETSHGKIYPLSISKEEIKNIKQRIESCSEEELKAILTKLIDEYPNIIETIEKYLERA